MKRLRQLLPGLSTTVGVSAVVGAAMLAALPVKAEQTKLTLLLDWAWLPYHSALLIAQEKGYYSDAGLDVTIEQGRGSATTAVLLSQEKGDIAHLNITNAAQVIGKGGALKVIAIYQHQSGASFVGIKGNVELDGPESLVGPGMGSTPGGSDALSLKIFSKVAGLDVSDLDIVSLEANAKTAALFGGRIDLVSGDAPAFNSYVRATGQEPETLLLSDHGLPLIGFGFAASETFLERHPEAATRFLAATKRGFQDMAEDPAEACSFMAETVHLAGEQSRCIDYGTGLLALSASPSAADWGMQTEDQWEALTSTLLEVGELDSDQPPSAYYTNEFVPQ